MRCACGQVRVAAGAKFVLAAIYFEFELAIEDVQEALRGGWAELAAGFEFGGVLGESRAHCWASMNDRNTCLHAGQRGSNESVGRQKEMIVFLGAARLTKIMQIMHGTSFFEVRRNSQADRASASRIRALWRRRRVRRIPLDRG